MNVEFANPSGCSLVIKGMRMLTIPGLALLAACGGPYLGRVQGHVVDEQDQPVAGARIMLSGADYLVSDEHGNFNGELTFQRRRWTCVTATSEDSRLWGAATISHGAEPVAITLRRHVRVIGRVHYDKLPPSIRVLHDQPFLMNGPRVTVRKKDDPIFGEFRWEVRFEGRAFESFLKPGIYELEVTGFHHRLIRDFLVTRDGGDIDLGVLEAIPLPDHDMLDSPAPELQVSDGTKLADLRGKWVLLLLWDRRSTNDLVIRRVVRFHNDPQVDRSGFAIVAVHRDALSESELERARTHDHEGRRPEPIPFPIAFDDRGRTFDAYRLTAEKNALFVINPEGKLEFTRWTEPVEYVRGKLKK